MRYWSSLSFVKYCTLVFFAVLIPTLIILGTVYISMATLGLDMSAWSSEKKLGVELIDFVGIVIFSPVVETTVLVLLISIVGKFVKSELCIAAVCATCFAVVHSFFGLLWFLGPFWSFFVLSYAYMMWRSKSKSKAYLVALLPHAMNNFCVVIVGAMVA